MVRILKKSIKAERTGRFDLHLQSVAFFAAAGHHNYAKSARLYLQQMMALKDTHPKVYQDYQEGHHVFQRSDRYWAGLSQDLVIEQVLMRSLKTSGGLTRGTGFGERQRPLFDFFPCLLVPRSTLQCRHSQASHSQLRSSTKKPVQPDKPATTRTLRHLFRI